MVSLGADFPLRWLAMQLINLGLYANWRRLIGGHGSKASFVGCVVERMLEARVGIEPTHKGFADLEQETINPFAIKISLT